ncbi:MAG: hypothetical protein WCC25_11410, partial [Candidatus Korobacteraceae bacterium]
MAYSIILSRKDLRSRLLLFPELPIPIWALIGQDSPSDAPITTGRAAPTALPAMVAGLAFQGQLRFDMSKNIGPNPSAAIGYTLPNLSAYRVSLRRQDYEGGAQR